MNADDLFGGFNPTQYEHEVRQRWGDSEAFRESARRTKRYTKRDWAKIRDESDDIFRRLAAKQQDGAAPDGDDVVELAEQHRLHIDRWFYPCTRMIHAGLGGMYLSDERFSASIDAHGDGLTIFLAAAIRANAGREP